MPVNDFCYISVEPLQYPHPFLLCISSHPLLLFLFISHCSFYSMEPLHSIYALLTTSIPVSVLSVSCVSLFCRPVWISGNRSACGKRSQKGLGSNWRYCGILHHHTAIIITQEAV